MVVEYQNVTPNFCRYALIHILTKKFNIPDVLDVTYVEKLFRHPDRLVLLRHPFRMSNFSVNFLYSVYLHETPPPPAPPPCPHHRVVMVISAKIAGRRNCTVYIHTLLTINNKSTCTHSLHRSLCTNVYAPGRYKIFHFITEDQSPYL